MVVVMMVWCTLDVMVVVYCLTGAVLRKTALSSVEWSGCVGLKHFVVGLVMMMVMMVTVLLVHL